MKLNLAIIICSVVNTIKILRPSSMALSDLIKSENKNKPDLSSRVESKENSR